MQQLDIDIYSSTSFCKVMNKYGSDKGSENYINSWHNYTLVYYELFNKLINDKLNIFELGIGTNYVDTPCSMGIHGKPGASLRGWAELFPNSRIYGADIDKRILFNDDRICTYYCDQTSQDSIHELWNTINDVDKFDIIIDDGLHEFYPNVNFFENSIHKLKYGGYYIIEDIVLKNSTLYENKIREWQVKYPNLSFNFIQIPSFVNNVDNALIIITYI